MFRKTLNRPESESSNADRLVRYSQHWGLYMWQGHPKDRDVPTDPVPWLKIPHLRRGCANHVHEATSWVYAQLIKAEPPLSTAQGPVDPELAVAEVEHDLFNDRDVVLHQDRGSDQRWIMAVISSPLCLSPTSCLQRSATPIT